MFVKKLVEKASIKKPGGSSDGLKASDVDPRLVFHHGIPLGSQMFAYDSIQKILAVSTKDGRIKLFGRDNTQALLESEEVVQSKFLEFMQSQGFLINVNLKNQIEVWDIEKKLISDVHVMKEEITSFKIMQHGLYMYVGDSAGNVRVFKLDQLCHIVRMKYTIPFSASHGNSSEASGDTAVISILPQPTAESKRILIIFRDGIITLWEIRESKSIFATGGSMLQSVYREGKQVTSACWVCPFGTKVAVGYSSGDILIWSIPTSNLKAELGSEGSIQTGPTCKLNLSFKSENIPIASLKWSITDAKASQLYIMGASDVGCSTNLLQVVLLNEHTESRTVKLGLPLSEPCIHMEIIASTSEQTKQKQDFLILIGKSGHVYVFDDSSIERYLLQYQSRSPPSLPREVMVKMPFPDSNITVAKLITNNHHMLGSEEDYIVMAKGFPSLFPSDTKSKDGTHLNSNHFSGFTKIKNLYITGHNDGAINFWDLSCPFPIPVFSLKQQSEDDFSLSGIALTALHFDGDSRILVSGDQSGMVRIFKFKPEPYVMENSFMSFQGAKKGNNHIVHSVKVLKVNGSVLSINISHSSRHLAVGSDQGYVSLFDMESLNLLFEKHLESEICAGIASLQLKTCNLQNFERNILLVATKDSSIWAFDSDTGNMLSTSMVCPKKPSRALFMQILDGQDALVRGSKTSEAREMSRGGLIDDAIAKQLYLLLCSEKAIYVYSFNHAVQGIKKVQYKKKFHSTTCCFASTFYYALDIGLMLLYTCGKVEIRSLPDLSLLKETSIRGFRYSTSKLNSLSDTSICSSWEGDLVMMNGDQEFSILSVLLQKESFRLLDHVSQVYKKDLMLSQEEFVSSPVIQREKKKGIFGSVFKDSKGSKAKHVPEVEIEDTKESIEELSPIFSTANFPCDVESGDNLDEAEVDLDIDDINLDDHVEKPKEQNRLPALNKQKLASKFHAFTGKLKQMKVKNEKGVTIEEHKDEKGNPVDQIKKRYGFSSSGETNAAANMSENKLHENLRKLQGISLRTSEMQDTAKSFASMAKELLRTTDQDRRSS